MASVQQWEYQQKIMELKHQLAVKDSKIKILEEHVANIHGKQNTKVIKVLIYFIETNL